MCEIGGAEDSAQPPDRPKWRRAGRLEKQRGKSRKLKIRPRTNLNGGDLVRSTFLVLTFAFALAFMALCPCPYSCLSFSLLGQCPYLFVGNGEKRRIWSQSGVMPFGAFGWAFARAHCDLRRRFTFHRSWLKAGIYCARRGSREGRSRCRRGWLSQWGPGCMPTGCIPWCTNPGGRSYLGSESTTGHCRLSVLQMPSAVSARSSTINLSEMVIHAPPPSGSEVHTCLGNIEMGWKFGMPAHLCQYDGKLYISRFARSWCSTGASLFAMLQFKLE